MSENIYAPPSAALNDVVPGVAGFYVVSQKKLLVLGLLSFGFYIYVWAYKNWSAYKKANQLDLWPLARAIFFIFFMHQLYRHADDLVARSGRKFDFDFEQWATVFVVLKVLVYLFDAAASQVYGLHNYKILLPLATILCAYILSRCQGLINFAAGDPDGQSNDRFNAWNYLVIVPGIAVWCLTVLRLWMFYPR